MHRPRLSDPRPGCVGEPNTGLGHHPAASVVGNVLMAARTGLVRAGPSGRVSWLRAAPGLCAAVCRWDEMVSLCKAKLGGIAGGGVSGVTEHAVCYARPPTAMPSNSPVGWQFDRYVTHETTQCGFFLK